LEDYGVSEVTALAQHFKKQLSPAKETMQALHNEVLGKRKRQSELLELALANNERFPI
jgi:hypothetical protein